VASGDETLAFVNYKHMPSTNTHAIIYLSEMYYYDYETTVNRLAVVEKQLSL